VARPSPYLVGCRKFESRLVTTLYERMFGTIHSMSTRTLPMAPSPLLIATMKVVVSRPAAAKAAPPPELAGPECCWTEVGEILVPIGLGCDPEPHSNQWHFVGLNTSKSATWGVVELRSIDGVRSSATAGGFATGWEEEIDGFGTMVYSDLLRVSARIRHLPVGAVVGVFGTSDDEYIVFDRSSRAAGC
jgi:hypothetical protein